MKEVDVHNFSRSIEVPLDKKISIARGVALRCFGEKAKGSLSLRRGFELTLTRKMEKKEESLRDDYNRFYRSWTKARKVGYAVITEC